MTLRRGPTKNIFNKNITATLCGVMSVLVSNEAYMVSKEHLSICMEQVKLLVLPASDCSQSTNLKKEHASRKPGEILLSQVTVDEKY